MHKFLIFFIAISSSLSAISQAPKTYTSSEILLQLKKLNVLGSVLYIAAHPDDENTRLLAYLANEKLYRTGYLSLTRGDGGQNLIGDEQGIDLGLIRTQELLSARRIDGAEQFFSRAYDFGFCKTSEEALQTWGHDKILSDVVWVIRKFKPDVIIVRFPEDSRAGHGHHAASGILAREAFDAAADKTKFPEQLTQGVSVWQSKRLLWNTFNFGGTNTQSEDQFKLDVGTYNPLLGKGYGEIASLSRSQHKSQGFGVPAQRGTSFEYFTTVKGDKPVNDLMDGVDITWKRTANDHLPEMQAQMVRQQIDTLISKFSPTEPQRSVAGLVKQYEVVKNMPDGYWKMKKLKELQNCIEAASGLFLDATTNSQFAVIGDSIKITITANNRTGLDIRNIDAHIGDTYYVLGEPKKNENLSHVKSIYIDPKTKYTQPYWLAKPMDPGSFNVSDQQQIGMAETESFPVSFLATIEGTAFTFNKQVRYKYTDPVKGELYQPVSIIPVADLKFEKNVYLFKENDSLHVDLSIFPNIDVAGNIQVKVITEYGHGKESTKALSLQNLSKDKPIAEEFELLKNNGTTSSATIHALLNVVDKNTSTANSYKRTINYDHIPSIVYQKEATTKAVKIDIKTDGKMVGYIEGAGDKVPEALTEMGYKVVMLTQAGIRANNLKQFDAIITGVRAYNTNEWMNKVYDVLMQYVKEGGILITQYNTSNQLGPVRSKISPYPFTISRNRVTDENAKVNFLLPGHPVLNYPNKITEKDFEGWIQERSIYNAEKIDSNYQRILSMQDPGEPQQDGSLIIANYGKGRFVYTGLVFFRELPAGVPGAYRLFANLIAAPAAITKANNKDKKGRGK
ncbi:MAG: PIG-L family deacetylase [Ferruginibacter sp.]